MKKKLFGILALTLVLLILFPSCSKATGKNDSYNEIAREESSADFEDGKNSALTDTALKTENGSLDTNRKIIQNLDLTVQTKQFDALLEKIQKEVSSCGGYVQESSTRGREIASTQNRYANMVLRIPAEKSSDFDSFLSENSVVISRSVSTEDVTLNYVDMESRVSALETEKAALEELLKNASSVEEIIQIREKLTDVIYEIESYKSKLRTYDNLVEYCTVTLHINEVERTAIVEKQSVWQEIGTNLKNNFESVWKGLVFLFIFLISAIPFLIPIVIIVILIILLKKRKAKAKKKIEENNKL